MPLVKSQSFSFSEIPYLSRTDVAYQLQDPALKPFFRYAPEIGLLVDAMKERDKYPVNRELLTTVIRSQHLEYDSSDLVLDQINALREESTYTIITAHQPCLMTGPLYTIIKAISTIKAAQMATKVSGKLVIPIFVVGGEDHDFDEMNHFNLYHDQIIWENAHTGGPVGRMDTGSMEKVLLEISEKLSDQPTDRFLSDLITRTHRPGRRYAIAFADLIHNLLGKYGLVVALMDDPGFKNAFKEIMVKEIQEQISVATVRKAQEDLESAGFKAQAYVRELNLFYLGNGLRERILPTDNNDQLEYIFENSGRSFTTEELCELCRNSPENFSPNVVMRPLYQEFIFPNLAYIGGGGELAYWLERKSQFEAYGIPYPMLIRRDSILWISSRDAHFISEIGIKDGHLFDSSDEWIRFYLESRSTDLLDLETEKKGIESALHSIVQKSESLDPTLARSLEAEKVRILKAVEQIESRLYRTAKQKNEQTINKLTRTKEKLFPNNGLMERAENFIPYFSKYGDTFFEVLLENLNPFDLNFKVLSEN